YFPLGQAALTLDPAEGLALQVKVRTLTPNFQEFRVRRDGGAWSTTGDTFTWPLHEGINRLEVVSVNRFGVEGAPSTVELDVR
ncbi:MAG: hypothetical protein QHJ73_09860, partial [Armatimonadota bacterium]|nr:hypothetical protein [Armatimonadota bacterium]